MKMKEIRELKDEELTKQIQEYRRELMNLRFQHATAQLENTQRIPYVKKSIARMLTVENAKKRMKKNG